jgi:outer membrane protein TolC
MIRRYLPFLRARCPSPAPLWPPHPGIRTTLIGGALVFVCAGNAALQAQTAPVRLSMRGAVERALSAAGNTRIRLDREQVAVAQSRAAEARAALMPSVDGALVHRSQSLNLETFGLPTTFGGTRLPNASGPFNVVDVRLTAMQPVFDLGSLRRVRAAAAAIDAARADSGHVRNEVAVDVATAYLAALRADASVEAAEAGVALAKALLLQAEASRQAGAAADIDVTRARVQMATDEQRLLAAELERRRRSLDLRRLVGLTLDVPLELTDALEYVPVEHVGVTEAIARAFSARADLDAQGARERSAAHAADAVAAERLPTVAGFADYGSIGTALDTAFATRTFGVAVRLPLFDGGRRDALRAASASQLREERVRTHDLRQQIELDIRLALESLALAEQQVKLSRDARALAEQEIAQERIRLSVGVVNSVDVTNAQARLAAARETEIEALFNYNRSRLELGRAMGSAEAILP